ncbi:hypothetical protein D3C86_1990470 [compost metagenome]
MPGSCVNKLITLSAVKRNKIPNDPKNSMLKNAVLQTDRSALSGKPAPRFCPTNVAAAFAIPQAGMMAKITTRIAIV